MIYKDEIAVKLGKKWKLIKQLLSSEANNNLKFKCSKTCNHFTSQMTKHLTDQLLSESKSFYQFRVSTTSICNFFSIWQINPVIEVAVPWVIVWRKWQPVMNAHIMQDSTRFDNSGSRFRIIVQYSMSQQTSKPTLENSVTMFDENSRLHLFSSV